MEAQNTTPIRRALISVSDKTHIVALAEALHAHGAEILSTGGTARALVEAGLPIKEVGAYTGHPEMLDGRVKTLHPRIHGGLLGRRDLETHLKEMREHDIPPIDLVVVNLYPFEAVAQNEDADWATLIENIDIGGPSMLRSAAKNHESVVVLTDPEDYAPLIKHLEEDGGTDLVFRRTMAVKAISRTAEYDTAISQTLIARNPSATKPSESVEGFPDRLHIEANVVEVLRYGENPHQNAAVYAPKNDPLPLANSVPLQGKALSYNNLLDADAALFSLRCLCDGTGVQNGAVVIKHGTPCGSAWGASLLEVWHAALSGDPVSAFGGIVAISAPIDGQTAEAMKSTFLEVVIAPAFTKEARDVFAAKKNLRLMEIPNMMSAPLPAQQVRSIAGGFLVQDHDRPLHDIRSARVVTERAPTENEWKAMDLAFRMCTAVRSNAITLANQEKLLGAGGGQTSRVDASALAVQKAIAHSHSLSGCALGSDAFFPFADGVEVAAEAGVKSIVQPGGSKRDAEVIEAADARGITMVFTGERHFRH
jgi:phosphoribosylaminoimidazolecarboxamide formyltransferase / IMP cyclohydrolase